MTRQRTGITTRHRRRLTALGTIFVAASVLLTAPAFAHVEVKATPAQAGAENAELTFTAEAESTTAGIVRFEVATPTDLDKSEAVLVSGPPGWALTPTDQGFAISGPALPPHQDLELAVRVRRLPNDARSEIKALVTYSDGHIDRWISLREAGQAEPEMPAALLELHAAPTTSPTTTQATTTTPTTTTAGKPATGGDRSRLPLMIGFGVAALVAFGVLATYRRRGPSTRSRKTGRASRRS